MKASLVVLTRPPNIYDTNHWPFTIALKDTLTKVNDCIVVKDPKGGLDRLLLSSLEGFTVAWYDRHTWSQQRLKVNCPVDIGVPGHLFPGVIGHDELAFFVCASVSLLPGCQLQHSQLDLRLHIWAPSQFL